MSYQILRQISRGGFSEVFEIRDTLSALDEVLILKRLSPEMSAKAEVRAAFTHEGKILSDLRHPNVVTFRRCFFDQGQICLVMEKVEGENIESWAQDHRTEPERVLAAFDKVIAAVDYLHHRPGPLLHLDLKPENILMTSGRRDVEPVLIDFGISRVAGQHGLKAYTPPYAAPEQHRGGQLGCFTDVHALGQILEELLGQLKGSLDGPRLDALRRVASKAKQRSRRRRYADAGEMMRAFRETRFGATQGSIDWLPGGVSWPALAVSIVAIVLLIGGTFWFIHAGSSASESASSTTLPPVTHSAAGEFELCLAPTTQGENISDLDLQFDNCVQQILRSDDLRRIEAGYLEAQRFVASHSHDVALHEDMERRLESLKREIELRTVATRP